MIQQEDDQPQEPPSTPAAPQAMEPIGPRGLRFLLWLGFIIVVLHGFVVLSILKQPIHWQGPPNGEGYWLLDPLFFDSVHRQGPFADFFAIYHAGVAVEHGISPYDYGVHEPIYITPYYYPYRYLPAVLIPARAMVGLFGPEDAAALWVLICMGMVAGAIALFLRGAGPLWFKVLCLTMLGLGTPIFLEYYMGQFTFAAAALALASLALAESRRGHPAVRWSLLGVGVTAASLVKVFPLTTLAALVRTGKGSIVAASALVAVFGSTALYFGVLRPEDWIHFTAPNFRAAIVPEGGNFGFVQLLAQIAGRLGLLENSLTAFFLRTGIKVLVLGAAAAIAFLARGVPLHVRGALLIVAYGLSYHHVWEHHYSAWMLASLVLLGWVVSQPGTRRQAVVMGVAIVLMAMPTLYPLFETVGDRTVWDPTEAWAGWQRFALCAQKAVPLLVVYCLAATRMASGGVEWPWNTASSSSME